MKKLLFALFLLPLYSLAQPFAATEINRWEKQAQQVTIIRDNYGIPHIYGKTDADAVFGLLYAQCEDDFKRVEMNYIEKLGRMAEVKGEAFLYDDLRIRMIIDAGDAKRDYEKAPIWMKKLCHAFADGINYYLYKHPEVKPALLTKFEPWYPYLWTDGSIGAIITAGLTVTDLKNLYTGEEPVAANKEPDAEENPTGSNGFAFSPKITENGNAILYINPHVTFYFRPEVHMSSEEGLNVYGAVTWGQFFIYQGFNERCGWMHTSSAVDATDSYIEKISKSGNGWAYEYNGKQRKVIEEKIVLKYKNGTSLETKTINALFTHHGPVMAKQNDQWLSVRADNRIANGLMQCWLRNKANSFVDFKKTLDLKGNISNNTVYADAEGNIAYWHGNRIPKRDTQYNWSKPVDGTTPATEWQGYHNISETVQSINPPNGWLQNCNATPYTVAGVNSPKKESYPLYMAPDGENFRGINAVRTLSEVNRYSIDKVIKAGYDTRLAAFEVLVPALVTAFEKNVAYNDSLYALLIGPVTVLKHWDYHCSENSIATTLAVGWGTWLGLLKNKMKRFDIRFDQTEKLNEFLKVTPQVDLLYTFYESIKSLEATYGKWQISWGVINRFQRISTDIDNKFDDNKPSLPVGFASSQWGCLPSYISNYFPGTQKRYGEHGNSFVCAVEFGKKIKAKSLLAGGQSGNENSSHFFDQGLMYSKGQFKEVLFYKEDVVKKADKTYHPGE
jgi:acyl-homoserine-lactone acylase